jgi:hypothetical protein
LIMDHSERPAAAGTAVAATGSAAFEATRQWPRAWVPHLLMLVLGVLCACLSLLHASPINFYPDSASYLEQARHLLAGSAPQNTPWGLEKLDTTTELSRLFPPGYAISIAAVATVFPLKLLTSAVAIELTALIALPLLCFVATRQALGDTRAMLVAALTATSYMALLLGSAVVSDVYCLVLAVAAFALLMRGETLGQGILCGLLAGIAYTVRNASTALLISIALYCVACYALQPERQVPAKRFMVGTLVGCALPLLPLILWRFLAFGTLQPYAMPPSTVSLKENIGALVAAYVADIGARTFFSGGLRSAVQTPAGHATIVALGLIGALAVSVVLVLTWRARWPKLPGAAKRAVLFCAIYAVCGSTMIVIALTRWQWYENIKDRLTMQYMFFVWTCLAAFTLKATGERRRSWLAPMAWIIALGLVTHGIWILQILAHYRDPPPSFLPVVAKAERILCSQPPQTLLISNVAWLYRVRCELPVRTSFAIDFTRDSTSAVTMQLRPDVELLRRDAAKRRIVGVFVNLTPTVESAGVSLGAADRTYLETQGWSVLDDEAGLVALERRPLHQAGGLP